MGQGLFTFTVRALRLEECKYFVALLTRQGVRVGPWATLELPITPLAQS